MELDPKHAFEKAKKSILDKKFLKARFMAICNVNKLCSEAVTIEVYPSILTKNNPCQICCSVSVLETTRCEEKWNRITYEAQGV